MAELSKTNLRSSWGQKLFVVIILTLAGLVVVTGSAYRGLNSVNSSFELQSKAVGYQKTSLLLTNRLLELEASASELTFAEAQSFKSDLVELKKLAQQMSIQSTDLNYQQLIEISNQLGDLSAEYVLLRTAWLENGLLLGFSPEEGKLAALSTALGEIEKISFSMIKESVNNLIFTQSKYIVAMDLANENKIDEIMANLEAVVVDMDWQENVIGIVIADYRKAFNEARALVTKAGEISTELFALTKNLQQLVRKQNTYLEQTVINQVINEASEHKESAMGIILVVAVSVGLIILISLGFVARQLSSQLQQMQRFLKGAANGDFSRTLPTNDNHKDEFTQLRHASNQMMMDISRVISEVINGNKSLLDIRSELEHAVEQLSLTSEEVEQKTQQSTVATDQISIALNDVAKRSTEVSEISQAASASTNTGKEVISTCANSMVETSKLIETTHDEVTRLTQSSKKMLGIVDVINGLADKTNLLALNAAIESARAGEAGRGFSVVADEVRALAQKTVEATSSISEIIQTFNKQSKRIAELMDEGIALTSAGQQTATDAMDSINSIESSVKNVVSEMDQIVVAVEEISYNTGDIASQVKHICEQTEQNKKTREKLEIHTRQLSAQAETVGTITNRFTLSSI